MEERPFSDISYEKFLNEEKLMGSRCKGCGTQYVPPPVICIDCYGSAEVLRVDVGIVIRT